MLNNHFYHGTIKKYVTVFGTLFNNVFIDRVDGSNNVIQTLKVPLAYGPKDKALARLAANPNLDKSTAIELPRMAFELTTMTYDGARKLQTVVKNAHASNTNPSQVNYQYVPVPYNFTFSLYVLVKNAEDGTRILEQILPYFTPDWTPTVNLIPEMDIKMDIPIVMYNVTVDDTYEGNFDTRRAIIWTLDFMLKGYLFGPVKKSGIIKTADVNFFEDTTDDAGKDATFTITPGLTANGQPTSNSSETIDKSLINANSNYGYITART